MGHFEPEVAWGPPEAVPEQIAYVDRALAATTLDTSAFGYLDCGVWAGDDRSSPARRCFAVVCGRSVALCEFRVGDPFEELCGGQPAETRILNKVLSAIAGRQRLDVQVLRFLRVGQPDAAVAGTPPVYIFLPDVQLPLATRLEEVDPNVIPDPRAATCMCCGPILARLMYGQEAESQYRAYGCNLGRDPNAWFVTMTEHFYDPADDLVTFMGRLQKLRRSVPFHFVQLGEMFEVWAGYGCCFQASGRAAMVVPQVVRGIGVDELMEYWRTVTVDSPIKRALESLCRLPASDRTIFGCSRDPGPEIPYQVSDVPLPSALDVPDLLFAERPEALAEGEPPVGLFALLEQNAMFLPWRRPLDPAGRVPALQQLIDRWRVRAEAGTPFPLYVTSGSQLPCLTNVVLKAA